MWLECIYTVNAENWQAKKLAIAAQNQSIIISEILVGSHVTVLLKIHIVCLYHTDNFYVYYRIAGNFLGAVF